MFNGYRVSVGDENALEMGGHGCTTKWMYLTHLKMVKMVKFMLHIVYHNKKETRQQNFKTCAKFFSCMPLSLPTKLIPWLWVVS